MRTLVVRPSTAKVAPTVVGPPAWLTFAVLGLCAACGNVPASPDQPTAVLSLILIADESVHIATITEGARADSAFPAQPVPIGPARVDLRVLDDSDAVHPFVPESTPGRYRVALTVTRGRLYRLTGTVDGAVLQAQTTVPSTFVVVVPADDTITEAEGRLCDVFVFPREGLCVPYVFQFDGPPAFGYRVEPSGIDAAPNVFQFDGPPAFEYRVEPSGIDAVPRTYNGELVFVRHSGDQTVTFLAFNSDAAEWLRSTPRSNILGGFGGFGAALEVRRRFVVQ